MCVCGIVGRAREHLVATSSRCIHVGFRIRLYSARLSDPYGTPLTWTSGKIDVCQSMRRTSQIIRDTEYRVRDISVLRACRDLRCMTSDKGSCPGGNDEAVCHGMPQNQKSSFPPCNLDIDGARSRKGNTRHSSSSLSARDCTTNKYLW